MKMAREFSNLASYAKKFNSATNEVLNLIKSTLNRLVEELNGERRMKRIQSSSEKSLRVNICHIVFIYFYIFRAPNILVKSHFLKIGRLVHNQISKIEFLKSFFYSNEIENSKRYWQLYLIKHYQVP